jgi:dienelactone hydrolase
MGNDRKSLRRSVCAALPAAMLAMALAPALGATDTDIQIGGKAVTVTFESVELRNGAVTGTLELAYARGTLERHPVILMLGSLNKGEPPPWSTGLVAEGYMLAAFKFFHPPDPDPARRSVWLAFDEAFAHGYAFGDSVVSGDARKAIDLLVSRPDVNPSKIGWMGSSSTGIPGLAAITRDKRIAAIVAFVSTGAHEMWLDSWTTHGLWRGKPTGLWPETRALLREYDPIHHVDKVWPTAVLMVSGGSDKVVDPATAAAFVDAVAPYYKDDPERLRLVVYHGFGHNLPADVVRMYTENWFHLYMHPTKDAPEPAGKPRTMDESVSRTQINAASHKGVVTGK